MSQGRITRRQALKLGGAGAAAAATSTLAAPAVWAQAQRPTIKLVSVNSLSGPFARYGQELQRGVELAIDHVNAKGITIGGKSYGIALQNYDDKTDASTSSRLVERAVTSDRADFIIAGCGSVITKAIIPVAQRLRAPMMTHWAQVDGVFAGQKGNPFVFGAMPPFSRYYTRISEMATKLDNPKIKRVAMITPNDELGVFTAREYLPNDMKASGLELVGTEIFPAGSKEFGPALDRLSRLKPDMLVINCYTPEIIAIFKEMQAVKFFPPMIVVEAPTRLPESLGEGINGVFVPTFWDPTLDKTKDEYIGTSRDFAKLYQERYKEVVPDFVAACGANNIVIMARALNKVGKLGDPRGVQAALRTMTGESFFSPIQFSDDGLNQAGGVYPSQFQNGKTQMVYPPDIRTSAPVHPYPGWKA